jgi:4-cresol dehydrogenase (hydroxylating) flavoprotein subunit
MNEKTAKMPVISPASGEIAKIYGEIILGVTSPANEDELRALVLEAGRGKFSLHIHGFGISGQRSYKNVVIVDLSAMNKIVEVNNKSGYALVEPGVTYQQLYRYLQENDSGLWIDCDRNSQNSISASIADHEFGYTAYGDHMMMQCGVEVMLANGELTRLGMGAMPGSNTWQLAKYAIGPYIDGLFTQSELGVITKIGVWLMPAPPAYKPFMLSLRGADDIAAAVEILRDLKINVIVPNSVVISNALLDGVPYLEKGEYLTESGLDIEKIKTDMNLGEWNLYGALYNTPDNVDVLWPMVSGALSSIEGSSLFTDDNRKGDEVWTAREGLMRGIPAEGFDDLNSWQGEYRCDIGIVCPPSGEDVLQLNAIVSDTLEKYQINNLSECVAGWRSIIKRNYFLFDEDKKEETEKCVNEVIKNAAEKGFGLTHNSTNHPDIRINYGTNKGMAVLQDRLKTALDPQQVLA